MLSVPFPFLRKHRAKHRQSKGLFLHSPLLGRRRIRPFASGFLVPFHGLWLPLLVAPRCGIHSRCSANRSTLHNLLNLYDPMFSRRIPPMEPAVYRIAECGGVAEVNVPRTPRQPITLGTVLDYVPPADPHDEERKLPLVLDQESRRRS